MKKMWYALIISLMIFFSTGSKATIVLAEGERVKTQNDAVISKQGGGLNFEDIYEEQFKSSGANKLKKNLPEEVQKDLDSIGVENVDWKNLSEINPQKIYNFIINKFKNKLPTIIKSILTLLSMVIICSIFLSVKLSTDKKKIERILNFVCLLSICVVIIRPIVSIIVKTASMMTILSKFIVSYIPIMAGVMYATGQSLLGSSYSTIMVIFSEFIMQMSSKVLIPTLNIFLALSVASSMPAECSFSGICTFFSKAVKWIIGVSTTLFVGILTIQSVITSAADGVGTKAIKFILSGSVPVVGKALGDALLIVNGSIKLLKSGIGAFFLLAIGVIFIPIILDCLTWKMVTGITLNISEAFGINSASKVIKNTAEVLSLLLIVVLCCMVVLIVSTSLIILINPINIA